MVPSTLVVELAKAGLMVRKLTPVEAAMLAPRRCTCSECEPGGEYSVWRTDRADGPRKR